MTVSKFTWLEEELFLEPRDNRAPEKCVVWVDDEDDMSYISTNSIDQEKDILLTLRVDKNRDLINALSTVRRKSSPILKTDIKFKCSCCHGKIYFTYGYAACWYHDWRGEHIYVWFKRKVK